MKAAYMLGKKITVGNVPDPVPEKGEVLVRTTSCGVCASDLHILHNCERIVNWSKTIQGPFAIDTSRPTVLGHEFVGEIIDYGPGTQRKLPIGTMVTSAPAVFSEAKGVAAIGLATDFPGGFGEYMVLTEELMQPIPSSLGIDLAAMAEPISVGLYYVKAARLQRGDVPLVIGCGAIGLAMIMALKLAGAGPIIAADFSASRRTLALKMGADIVVDPAKVSPYVASPEMEGKTPNVIFECVGTPGVLDGVIQSCLWGARILVAGWCLEVDHIFTASAHVKGLNVQFGGGPMPDDFDAAVRALCDGLVDPSAWIGKRVGMTGVAEALEAMRNPDNPIRTIIDPRIG